MADFIVECTWPIDIPAEKASEPPSDPPESEPTWVLHVDGASNSKGSGVGLIIVGPDGFVAEYALRFSFEATNNQVEYEALITGLKLIAHLEAKNLKVFTDSQLVVGQTTKEYEARDPTLARYLEKVKTLWALFPRFSIAHVPRTENARADALSRLATAGDEGLDRIFMEYLVAPSIQEADDVHQVDLTPSWMDRFVKYLIDGTMPDNPPEGRWFR